MTRKNWHTAEDRRRIRLVQRAFGADDATLLRVNRIYILRFKSLGGYVWDIDTQAFHDFELWAAERKFLINIHSFPRIRENVAFYTAAEKLLGHRSFFEGINSERLREVFLSRYSAHEIAVAMEKV